MFQKFSRGALIAPSAHVVFWHNLSKLLHIDYIESRKSN
jgi:hypothetical protein